MPRDKKPISGNSDMRNYTCDFCGNHFENQIPAVSYRDNKSREYVACSGCAPKAKETEAYRAFSAIMKQKENANMGSVVPYILTTGNGWTRRR
ncbi:MAG: hypothetical protein JW716_04080 [Candidatus Aenigmarchaeota archaeon]|nr:hypothetical protein [Candidatus Aenigmarchaeota archaeon]